MPTPLPDVAPPGSKGAPFASSRTFDLSGREPRQAWFICDGIDTGRLFVVGLPDPANRLSVFIVDKSQRTAPVSDVYELGAADPGAGQIYWPLSTRAAASAGNLHAFNPGALGDPTAATTPTFTSLELGALRSSCRWVEHTRLMGFSSRRSFLITQGPDGALTYRTFDFKRAAAASALAPDGVQRTTTPSLQIVGGMETSAGLVFTNQGYSYTVEVAAPGQPPHADVVISQDGKLVAAEALQAYTVGAAP